MQTTYYYFPRSHWSRAMTVALVEKGLRELAERATLARTQLRDIYGVEDVRER